MSYPVTIQSIIDRALKKADMFNSGFIDAANGEQMELFQEAYTEWYDIMVTRFENYFTAESAFQITAGTFSYVLPDDFYKLLGVDYKIGATPTSYITLKPFSEMERNGEIGTVGNIPTGEIKLRYVPAPIQYTDPTDTVQMVAGWDTLLVVLMAIAMREKEESDTASLERQLARQMNRVEEAAQNRDVGMPGRVNNIYQVTVYQQYSNLRYQLNQDSIKFLSTEILSAGYGIIY